eukprot:m.1405304 g.1405304  ORF g.1405304 m.1405304 type:complete len:345 (-) comp25012_c0_seq83:3253-4287(-)
MSPHTSSTAGSAHSLTSGSVAATGNRVSPPTVLVVVAAASHVAAGVSSPAASCTGVVVDGGAASVTLSVTLSGTGAVSSVSVGAEETMCDNVVDAISRAMAAASAAAARAFSCGDAKSFFCATSSAISFCTVAASMKSSCSTSCSSWMRASVSLTETLLSFISRLRFCPAVSLTTATAASLATHAVCATAAAAPGPSNASSSISASVSSVFVSAVGGVMPRVVSCSVFAPDVLSTGTMPGVTSAAGISSTGGSAATAAAVSAASVTTLSVLALSDMMSSPSSRLLVRNGRCTARSLCGTADDGSKNATRRVTNVRRHETSTPLPPPSTTIELVSKMCDTCTPTH